MNSCRNIVALILLLSVCSCFIYERGVAIDQITQMKIGKNGQIITGDDDFVYISDLNFNLMNKIQKPVSKSSFDYSQDRIVTLASQNQILLQPALDAASKLYKNLTSKVNDIFVDSVNKIIYLIEDNPPPTSLFIHKVNLTTNEIIKKIEVQYKGKNVDQLNELGTQTDFCVNNNWVLIVRGETTISLVSTSTYALISNIQTVNTIPLIRAKFTFNCQAIVAIGQEKYIMYKQLKEGGEFVLDFIGSLSHGFNSWSQNFIFSNNERSFHSLEFDLETVIPHQYISEISLSPNKIINDQIPKDSYQPSFTTDQTILGVIKMTTKTVEIYKTTDWSLYKTYKEDSLQIDQFTQLHIVNSETLIMDFKTQKIIKTIVLKDPVSSNEYDASEKYLYHIRPELAQIAAAKSLNDTHTLIGVYNLYDNSPVWQIVIQQKPKHIFINGDQVILVTENSLQIYDQTGLISKQSIFGKVPENYELISAADKVIFFDLFSKQIPVYSMTEKNWKSINTNNRNCTQAEAKNNTLGIQCNLGTVIQIWNLASLKFEGAYTGPTAVKQRFLTFSPNLKYIVSIKFGNSFIIESGDQYQVKKILEIPMSTNQKNNKLTSFCSPAQKLVQAVRDINKVEIIDLSTYQIAITKDLGINKVSKISFSDNCQAVIIVTDQLKVHWWDLLTNQVILQFSVSNYYKEIKDTKYQSSSNRIIVADAAVGYLDVVQTNDPNKYNLAVISTDNLSIKNIKTNQLGQYIAVSGVDVQSKQNLLSLYKQTGEKIGKTIIETNPIDFLLISPDNSFLIYYTNGQIVTYDITLTNTKSDPKPDIISMEIYDNNKLLLVFSNRSYQFYTINLNSQIQIQLKDDATITSTTTSANQAKIFLGYSNGGIKIVDQKTNTTQLLMSPTRSSISLVAFSDTTKTIYSYSGSKVAVWTNTQCTGYEEINQFGFCVCKMDKRKVNNICQCFDGYYDDNKLCQECSFICSTCSNSSSDCIDFAWPFYVLVIGLPILVFLIILVVAFILCNKKNKNIKGKNKLVSQFQSSEGGDDGLLK